ncbi:uncharacterized protein PHACADRAFT_209845 [Phanerochaete carnosa HHB-10118-sp]|uniref:Uncharacterized protein n=1 Tax=Phanerochaete carnosa (strain HHB-10118-sp) TaxID=650164 RepID=K5W4C7_PHACS|nr:uncharacterized protein PHACADRAFT_209845 [Phanerochaete carnosa HHB-10118-sp]EKM54015.1 hypothetical protein PHACADRAFT_209845 [Phanerochaete carnosa HHB-10118-sp]
MACWSDQPQRKYEDCTPVLESGKGTGSSLRYRWSFRDRCLYEHEGEDHTMVGSYAAVCRTENYLEIINTFERGELEITLGGTVSLELSVGTSTDWRSKSSAIWEASLTMRSGTNGLRVTVLQPRTHFPKSNSIGELPPGVTHDPVKLLMGIVPEVIDLAEILDELKIIDRTWYGCYPSVVAHTLARPVISRNGDLIFEIRPFSAPNFGPGSGLGRKSVLKSQFGHRMEHSQAHPINPGDPGLVKDRNMSGSKSTEPYSEARESSRTNELALIIYWGIVNSKSTRPKQLHKLRRRLKLLRTKNITYPTYTCDTDMDMTLAEEGPYMSAMSPGFGSTIDSLPPSIPDSPASDLGKANIDSIRSFDLWPTSSSSRHQTNGMQECRSALDSVNEDEEVLSAPQESGDFNDQDANCSSSPAQDLSSLHDPGRGSAGTPSSDSDGLSSFLGAAALIQIADESQVIPSSQPQNIADAISSHPHLTTPYTSAANVKAMPTTSPASEATAIRPTNPAGDRARVPGLSRYSPSLYSSPLSIFKSTFATQPYTGRITPAASSSGLTDMRQSTRSDID